MFEKYSSLDYRMLIVILKQAHYEGSVIAISDSIDWGMRELINLGLLAEDDDSLTFECRITPAGIDVLTNEELSA